VPGGVGPSKDIVAYSALCTHMGWPRSLRWRCWTAIRAHRAQLLLIAIACLRPREPDTPALERMVSMGAAIQNLLLGAHAKGSPRLRDLCRLGEGEVPLCCVNIGTVTKRKPGSRLRPAPAQILSVLGPTQPLWAAEGKRAAQPAEPCSAHSRA
jgi:nitroreductase